MIYDYQSQLRADIREHIRENYTTFEDLFAADEEGAIYDNCFISDSVTGNASGSYFCNAYKASEALAGNWEYIREACEEFGSSFPDSEEAADCYVRCYLLGGVLSQVIQEIKGAQSEGATFSAAIAD